MSALCYVKSHGVQVLSQAAPNYVGRHQMKLHGWYFEEQVLFQAGKTPRGAEEKLGPDDQQQEYVDGAGEIEHRDTETRSGR